MSTVHCLKIEGISHGIGIRLPRCLPLLVFPCPFPAHGKAASCLISQDAVPCGINIVRTFQFIDHIAGMVPGIRQTDPVLFHLAGVDTGIQQKRNLFFLIYHIKIDCVQQRRLLISAALIIRRHPQSHLFHQSTLPGINRCIQPQVAGTIHGNANLTGSIAPQHGSVVYQHHPDTLPGRCQRGTDSCNSSSGNCHVTLDPFYPVLWPFLWPGIPRSCHPKPS